MKVIVIAGPTGVGKTKLSVALAKRLHGEVINADSTQVYRNLDVATAKVTEAEKEGVPHHLFDFVDITEDYTVFDYQRDCRKKIDELLARNMTPILVGGTGLYIKAALYDYQFSKGTKLEQYPDLNNQELYQKLLQVDPNTQIHKNNRQRIVRALNYYEETGRPLSQKEKSETLLYDVCWIGLTTERSYLYERINRRVDQMVDQGLITEAKKIYDTNIRSKAVMTPIGYKELFPYFENQKSLDECLDEIRKNSRHYAKRQYTWFSHQVPITWFSVHFEDFSKTIEEVVTYIQKVDKLLEK